MQKPKSLIKINLRDTVDSQVFALSLRHFVTSAEAVSVAEEFIDSVLGVRVESG